jgi:hypothetical protein
MLIAPYVGCVRPSFDRLRTRSAGGAARSPPPNGEPVEPWAVFRRAQDALEAAAGQLLDEGDLGLCRDEGLDVLGSRRAVRPPGFRLGSWPFPLSKGLISSPKCLQRKRKTTPRPTAGKPCGYSFQLAIAIPQNRHGPRGGGPCPQSPGDGMERLTPDLMPLCFPTAIYSEPHSVRNRTEWWLWDSVMTNVGYPIGFQALQSS